MSRTLPSFIFCFFILSFHIACKKDRNPSSDELAQEKLNQDAEANHSIVEGVGNLFIEQELIPNSVSQLIIKQAYEKDTIAYYGSVTSSGKLSSINAIVVSKNRNTSLLVSEFHPETSSSLYYSIINDKKSRLVLEVKQYEGNLEQASILEYDWVNNTSKTVSSVLLRLGKEVGVYTLSELTPRASESNCSQPQPSDDISKLVDNHLQHFECTGGSDLNKYWSLMEKVKNNVKYAEEKADLEFIQESSKTLKKVTAQSGPNFTKFKFERTKLFSILKSIEKLLEKVKNKDLNVSLIPFAQASDYNYDEFTDEHIKIVFSLEDRDSKLPLTNIALNVHLQLIDKAKNEIVYEATEFNSPVNGLLTFKIDPLKEDLTEYSELTARYFFSHEPNKKLEIPISLKFIKPEIILFAGNNQIGAPRQLLNSPVTVKVQDNQGSIKRPLEGWEIIWSVKTGGGTLAAATSLTNEQGVAQMRWTLGAEGLQTLEVSAKNQDGTLIGGSPIIFSATVTVFNISGVQVIPSKYFEQDNSGAVHSNAIPISITYTGPNPSEIAVTTSGKLPAAGDWKSINANNGKVSYTYNANYSDMPNRSYWELSAWLRVGENSYSIPVKAYYSYIVSYSPTITTYPQLGAAISGIPTSIIGGGIKLHPTITFSNDGGAACGSGKSMSQLALSYTDGGIANPPLANVIQAGYGKTRFYASDGTLVEELRPAAFQFYMRRCGAVGDDSYHKKIRYVEVFFY